jgi:hypothetical protein
MQIALDSMQISEHLFLAQEFSALEATTLFLGSPV